MWSRTTRSSNRCGFTLVELIVVMVIMAIAAAIVIPSMASTQGVEATSAARMVAADLEYAQNVAITYQDPVTVTFNSGGESYSLSNTSGPLIHPMTKAAYIVDFSARNEFQRLDVVSATFGGGPTVTFDELGTPDNPGNVTLQVGPHAYQVTVGAATGKVTVTYVGT